MFKKSFKRLNCPLNPRHIVPEDRLQTHLIKCMKNYPNHFTCPYNALHRFLDEADYKQHVVNCPEKKATRCNYPRVTNDVPLHLDLPKCDEDEHWD